MASEDSSSSINDSSIEFLNDHCLLHIFQYLTLDEKISIEPVCKNWNRVVKMSWNNMKSLELHSLLPYKSINELDTPFKKMNTSYIINVLKRCQFYLNKIKIQSYYLLNLNNEEVLNTIFEYCNNLMEVSLDETDVAACLSFFTDATVKQLFIKNKNISSICFFHLKVNGDFLLNLDIRKIKELHLEYCNFESNGCLYGFLGHLNNLNKLEIIDEPDKVNSMIDALNFSNCKSIFEIEICLNDFSTINNLLLFLSKQTKMHKLKLVNVLIDQNFLESLPTDSLKELFLEFHSDDYDIEMGISLNLSLFLSNQKKIRKLTLKNIFIDKQLPGSNQSKNLPQINLLEELDIEYRDSQDDDKQDNLSLFLSKQQGIHKLKLFNVPISKKLIQFQELSLLKENLVEFSLGFEEPQYAEKVLNISTFISKLKKIRKLQLNMVTIDERLMQNLPTEYLEELSLDYIIYPDSSNNVLKYLDRLQNLKYFEASFNELNDNHLENISKFINVNIKKIELSFYKYLPSDKQIPYFIRLSNLETFVLKDKNETSDDLDEIVDIDNILENLLHSKSLKYLKIEYCKFSSAGVTGISFIPSLSVLEVNHYNNTNAEILDLIYKSTSLEELRILSSYEVSNELVTKASDIKLERGDSRVLKIIFEDCDNIDCRELRNMPLIEVINNLKKVC